MALKGEGFAANDAKGGEQTPATDETSLPGRETDLFDREKLVVMKDVAMNQGACLGNEIKSIVAERTGEGRKVVKTAQPPGKGIGRPRGGVWPGRRVCGEGPALALGPREGGGV